MILRLPIGPRRARGVALVIVLAFVVLLTGLVVAFFSRAISERQISNSSANAVRVDLFTQDAVATTLGDLRQEIAAGSTQPFPAPTPGVYLYKPKAAGSAVPYPVGVNSTATANLLKRSANNIPFFAGANYDTGNFTPSNRASNSPSTSPSANGRVISPARWNKGLLLPKQNASSDTDSTPVTNGFTAPDWIVVARDGSNPTAWNPVLATNGTNPVVGRYAYNIYDEGGILDMNAAGYPAVSNPPATPQEKDPTYKPSLAFADLKQLPGISDLSPARQEQVIRTLVGWRNYASSAVDLTATNPSPGVPVSGGVNVSPGYTWSTGTGGNVLNYLNFLRLTNATFLSPANRLPVSNQNQSDRSFASRQQLMHLLLDSIADQTSGGTAERAALQKALQYLGTFSRGLNQPSYFPVSRDATKETNPRPTILPSYNTTDPTKGGGNNVGDAYPAGTDQDKLSPAFLNMRAEATFLRNDGVTQAVVGEPLVKTRFPLQRLAWLTYKGPSASRPIPTSNPGVDTENYDLWQLVNSYGISPDYLKLGTADNIKRSFGLEWDASNNRWKYDLHNHNGTNGAIRQLQEIADLKTREPDFFELLKASVDPGSLAKASASSGTADPSEGLDATGQNTGLAPMNFNYYRDIAFDSAIIQMGANIIDQFDCDGYPTRIFFDDGSGRPAREIHGVENLPYIYRVRTGTLRVREPVPQGYPGKRNVGGSDPNKNDVDGCRPERHSGSVNTAAEAAQYPLRPLQDTGVGVVLAVPDLWNPHDQNSSLGSPRPGSKPASLRVIASSATPDVIAANGAYTQLTIGGYGLGNTTMGRYKPANSYDPPGSGGGGSEPVGAVPPYPNPQPVPTDVPVNTPVPMFSRTPTSGGSLGTSMTNGYNNPQVIYSVPTGSLTAPTSSILTFAVPTAALFREPTLLGKPDTTTGAGLTMSISNPDVTQLASPAGPAWTGSALKGTIGSYTAFDGTTTPTGVNPLGEPADPGITQSYVGLYLGAYPLRWVGTRWSNGPYVRTPAAAGYQTFWVYTSRTPAVLGTPTKSITYSLQCQDVNGNWYSYDEKYTNTQINQTWSPGGLLLDPQNSTFAFADPRTSRFGAPNELYGPYDAPHYHPPLSSSWLDTTTDVFTTERPDLHAGFGELMRGTYQTNFDWGAWTAAGWHYKNIYVNPGAATSIFFESGLLAQNDPNYSSDGIRYQGDTGVGTTDAQFYTDPDGVVRRGTAAFLSASDSNALGQPLATASVYSGGKAKANAAQSISRPRVLNRPFRSVGELGYVFSGTPWKNLDFSTPESGYAELLDTFCVSETDDANGLVAGRLNLNTRQVPVVAAVIAGALTVDTTQTTDPIPAPTLLDSNTTGVGPNALAIANLLVKRTSIGPASNNGNPQPLTNVGDLVGRWVSKQTISNWNSTASFSPVLYSNHNIDGSKSYDGFSADFGTSTTLPASNPMLNPVAAQRETALRALAPVGNTRVWNLLIDVIAQTGRYPSGATGLNNFAVEGEQRCWLHVAIDRLTGKVIDSKLEIVKE